ncbi:MAG: transposase [Erysipelotrichales bacterium]|nr:transposase [Erysipelotrichales bacterium]
MSVSKVFIDSFNKLFEIENRIKSLSSEKRTEIRNKEPKKIIDSIYKNLIIYRDKVMPNSKLGKAINYSLNQWSHLIKFLEDERIEISNNRAERAIKPFVIGRKNWLFANSVKGAKSSEILYSIVETAKLNKLDIYEYLVYVIDHFEDLKDESKVYDYLPFSDKLPERLKVRT